MGAIASQITSLTIVFSTVYLDTDQRKHQSSASLAFVRGIHRRPVNSPHKWPVTRKMFPFDDVSMVRLWNDWGGSMVVHLRHFVSKVDDISTFMMWSHHLIQIIGLWCWFCPCCFGVPCGFTRCGCSFWCLHPQNPFSINIFSPVIDVKIHHLWTWWAISFLYQLIAISIDLMIYALPNASTSVLIWRCCIHNTIRKTKGPQVTMVVQVIVRWHWWMLYTVIPMDNKLTGWLRIDARSVK